MSIAGKYRPHYTYDEYCLWEGRWELIEGMPYAMSPAPVPQHQTINANLAMVFTTALKKVAKSTRLTYLSIGKLQKILLCSQIFW